MDVDVTNNVNAEGNVKIPLGIFTAVSPFREQVAANVMGSPSSSKKFEANGILKTFPWTTETSAGTVATLGTSFVTLTKKVEVKLDVKLSDTLTVIKQFPVSAIEVDFTSIWKLEGQLKIPPGSENEAPPL